MPNTIKPVNFNKGDDADNWLKLYEATSKFNSWTEEQKLLYVGNCFPPEYQEWALNLATADDSSWEPFRSSFIQKFTKKVSPMQIIMQLSSLKMAKNESAVDYIDRFLKLKTRYERESQRRNSAAASRSASLASLLSQGRHPTSTDTTPTTTPQPSTDPPTNREPVPATEDIIILTELAFIKYFVHGISNEFMRLTLKNRNFDRLDELFDVFKVMMEDNDDDFDLDLDATPVTNKKQINKTQETSVKTDEDYETLSKNVQSLTTSVTSFIQLMKEQQSKQGNTPKPDYPPCDSCNKKGHATRLCNAPCKNCNGPHSIIKCNAQASSSKDANASSHMLLEFEETEDDLLAIGEKRSRDDLAELTSNKKHATDAKPTTKALRSRTIVVPSTPVRDHANPTTPVVIPPVAETVSSPRPLSHVDIEALLKDKVFLLSLSDIAAISPKARAVLKKSLTKPHNKKRENKQEANLIDEPKSVRGTSAPRVTGAINSLPCEIILDGGCTPCIISFELVKKLKLTDRLESVDRKLIIGDGSSVPVKGMIKNLNINIGNAAIIYQDALCLDVGDKYTLIAGRNLMHDLKISTDWETHIWSIKLPHQTVKLDVYYEKRPVNHQSSVPTIMESLEAVADSTDSSDSPDDSDYSSDDEEGFLLLIDDDAVNPLFDDDGFAIGDRGGKTISSPSQAIHVALDDIYISDEANDRLGKLPSAVLDNPHLSSDQKKKALNLLVSFADVFGTGYKHLKKTDLVEFHVNTGDAKPVYQKPFSKFSYSELDTLKAELNEMVDHGVLVPHSYDKTAGNGWSFPCRYVNKKDGGKRLVTQFMKLNEVTVRDPWPIPSLKDTIEEIGSSSWLSNVDMLKGFNAIGVASDSVNKLTLSTPFGAFSYKALPFGVLNGPSAYARLMFLAVQPFMDRNKYPDPFLIHFFDDCSLFTNTFEDHLEKLKVVLAGFRDIKLTLNANKCNLFQHEIDLLGFNISKEGIKPLSEKVKKITDFPRPENQTGVRAFINLCGFYRSHINCFTEIVEPLLKLLKKDAVFSWTPDCENAFGHLKAAIVSAATLSFPDRDKTFYLFCDASNIGIGSTLSQKNDAGEFVPICFFSRKLQAAEINYPTVEKELLCVVNSVAKFRKYLLDRHFIVYTDNAATSYLFAKSEPNSRLLRWCLGLQEFDFTIKHIPGRNNVVVDVLSRFPPPDNTLMDDNGETVLEDLYEHFLVEAAEFYEEPLMKIYCKLKAGIIPKDPKELKLLMTKYKIYKDHLYKKLHGNTYVKIPHRSERLGVLQNIHDGYGHFGINATWKRLYSQYWWPNAYNDIKEYVKTCHLCQIYSDSNPELPIGRVPADYLFQQYSLDFVGPFNTSTQGNKFILVAVENFSNWPIAEAVSVQDSTVVANFLYEKIFCQFGPFSSILTDNGSPFSNDIIDKFLSIIHSKHAFTTPYRPQCNGKNEKLNGTLSRAIKKLTHNDPKNWDLHLHSVLYSYRTKVHDKTKLSPYQLLFGQNPLPTDSDPILELGNNLGFERYSKLVDRNTLAEVIHSFKPVLTTKDFERHPKLLRPGDLIIKKRKKRTSKLDTAFIPEIFKIITTYNNNTYKVTDAQGRVLQRAVNHNNIKQYFSRVPHNSGGEDVP